MVSDAFLQEIKYRCDVESVISKYVNLRRSGRGFVGLCPFHSEKTPSFHVNTDEQYFHCFGCGAGGDVITFIMRVENLDYIDALRFLAAQAGIAFPEDNENDAAAATRRRMLEINREAARFFYRCLTSPPGEKGLRYFTGRGLTPGTIRRFGLGYAPDSWDSLTQHLKRSGYSEEEIAAAALLKTSKSGKIYDAFRNRVMFPIIDVRGAVVGFGGRVMDDSKPKYLNSSDTAVFKKSRCLYALNRAKGAGAESLILCEGYMDVIALHQAGFENAVATLGTALTSEQARLMGRYAQEIIISYDADTAGQTAAQRAIRLLDEAGLSVRVLRIEGGKDPDEFIRAHGADQFRLMLEKSSNHIEYRLSRAQQKYDLALADGRVAYIKEAVEILATVENPLEREIYASRLQQQLEISRDAILSEIEKRRKQTVRHREAAGRSAEISATAGLKDRVNPEKSRFLRAAKAEEWLLDLFYHNPDYLGQLEREIVPEDFITAFNRRVFEALGAQIREYGQADLSRFSMEFSPEEMGEITAILSRQAHSNTIGEARDCIRILRSEKELHCNTQDREFEILEELSRKAKEQKKTVGGNRS